MRAMQRRWATVITSMLLPLVFAVMIVLLGGDWAGATIPVPAGQEVIPYVGVETPLSVGASAADVKPIAFGSAAIGGSALRLTFGVDAFSAPVDIYLALYSAVLGGNLVTISSDGSFHLLSSEGLVPWTSAATGSTSGDPFGVDIPLSALPGGSYVFFLLVMPQGGDLHGSWYLWTSSLSVLEPVFLPGSQPGEVGTFQSPELFCKNCHGANFDGGPGGAPDGILEGPFPTWRGSMMANAARDPLFWALLAVENKVFESKGVAIGDFCLRCHVPKGWLEGRSEPVDGSAFTGDDFDGVQCAVCHRMVDPVSTEGQGLVEPNVDEHRNAQFVVAPPLNPSPGAPDLMRGPYDPPPIAPGFHLTQKSEFHLKSEFCATCHQITNPYYDNTVVIESTYEEWKNSAYSDPNGAEHKECQDCHMPMVTGYASVFQNPLRDNIALHEFVGGNAWAPLAIKEFDKTLTDDHKAALDRTVTLANQQLRRAALLEASAAGGKLSVTVTNLTGHKLPTGYTEGRRMWVNVKFYSAQDALIGESGAYDAATGVLTHDGELKLYESEPGLKNVEGFDDGPSFHFGLNNHLYKDNRIPPKGFTNAAYATAAPIVGASYPDGQNWDTTEYAIPAGATRAEVTLYYQTTTKEFVEFLRDQNQDNKWDANGAGAAIYDIWQSTGRAAPVAMAEASSTL